MKITNLKTEYMTNPLGIDRERPVFGWNVETDRKNWRQESCRIQVTTDPEAPGQVWDSGKVDGPHMVNVPYEGPALQSDTRYYWQVQVWGNDGDTAVSGTAFFHTGLLEESCWQGKWIGETDEDHLHIYRTTFSLEKPIACAMLYICGLGQYELYINGEKPDDRVLDPGWTTYGKRCLYAAFDVKEKLQQGDNAMGLWLGNGMYHAPKVRGRYVYYERSYGYPKALIQLNIRYEDGTTERIVSGENWRMAPSPITYSGIYGGEKYDARLEKRHFARTRYTEDEDWQTAAIVEAPEGKLTAQVTPPLKVMETYSPVSVVESRPGVYLYDFGRNFSGWVSMEFITDGSQNGVMMQTKTAEVLKPGELYLDQSVTGKNYGWEYFFDGRTSQTYTPKFSYSGFRYVQVKGAVPAGLAKPGDTRPVIRRMVGQFIYPDAPAMGGFACDNQLFNQIHQIILQAMKSNIKSIFTDCPHREKLGWMEETHLIGPAMMFNFDLHNLYEKIEGDMADAQHDDGLVPDICPEYVTGFDQYHTGFVDSPEWGSACIINPWHVYKKYGDSSIFRRYYGVMRRYMEYLIGKTYHGMLHHGLGDWLDIGPNVPHSQNTPVPVVATAVYYQDLTIMEQVAGLLGETEDAAWYGSLREETYREYNRHFYDDQTYRYATGSQAAQAMSLVVGLVPEEVREGVTDYLEQDIVKRGYATTAGDIGHPYVTAALTQSGRSRVLNAMMNVTDKPGYGYQVKCGATTLTEEWDGPDPAGPHGSQNHFMLGSGEEWFYSGLAGIRGLRGGKPFDEVCICPHFAEGVGQVEAWHMHPYGKMAVKWQRTGERVEVEIILPPGVSGVFEDECSGRQTPIGSGTTVFLLDAPQQQG